MTASRSPPPADEQQYTSPTGPAAASSASTPSRTSPPVVGCVPVRTRVPSAVSTTASFVSVDPTSTHATSGIGYGTTTVPVADTARTGGSSTTAADAPASGVPRQTT